VFIQPAMIRIMLRRSANHIAALCAHHGAKPQPHFVGTFGGDQQHAALPLDGASEEGLSRRQGSEQVKNYEGLAGTLLAAEQPVAADRKEVLDQPVLQRPRIRIAVGVERRQLGILRRLFVNVVIETVAVDFRPHQSPR
jgi:hypothetical protein